MGSRARLDRPASRRLGPVWAGPVQESYNAGSRHCPACGGNRAHLLVVRSWQLAAGPWVWEFRRRYQRLCQGCGRLEQLQAPAAWAEEVGAEPGSLANSEPAPSGPSPGEAGSEEPAVVTGRGELYQRLSQRMEFLLSPLAAGERKRLSQRARPGVAGLFMEYARREAAGLAPHFRALAPAAVPDAAHLERALAEELFATAWAGYICCHALRALGAGPPGGDPGPGPARDGQEGGVPPLIPRVLKRAERGRGATPPEVIAWFSDYAAQGHLRLAERGQGAPPRVRSRFGEALRACLHIGYATAVEELQPSGLAAGLRPGSGPAPYK